jgi:hypothetical protein
MKRSTFFFTLIGSTALGMGPAQAAETCYDFTQQSAGQKFLIGNTVQAEHLKVHFRDYRYTGVKADPGPGVQFVEAKSTMLAGGSSPELYMYKTNMLIEPRSPVAQIRFRVGESRGGPNHPLQGHANVIVNGKTHEVTGGLSQLNGREFGDNANGKVLIEVPPMAQVGSNPDDHWYNGTMKVRATSGQIKSFGIGGAPVAVDDVCITPNAP